MTRFVLKEALGSETNYNNLIQGTLTPDLPNTTASALRLLDTMATSVTISGANLQYSFAPPAIIGGTVLSIAVANSSAVGLLTIDQFPANSQAATFYQNFVGNGLAGLFTSLNSGNDVFIGNSFANTLNGGNGRDRIAGAGGADRLNGGAGADTLSGGAGKDTLQGGAAADVIAGGTGNDKLTGGTGFDDFVFRAGEGTDTITDFSANSSDRAHLRQDHIVVTQVLKDNFEKSLITDIITNAVLGLKVEFFDAGHTYKGSLLLLNVLTLDAITASDFIVG